MFFMLLVMLAGVGRPDQAERTCNPGYCTQRSSQKVITELPLIVPMQRPGRIIFKLRPNGKMTHSNFPTVGS
jgi:hypothetical protein